uniref:NADH-ubiquinone oxidoreductase chain 2 n=1 Tax=Flustra foliacea TaxID=478208 RepID=H2ESU1_9BILA|nr:NADH dehydrogenase subunit 2 [Flustra foliacea]AEX16059.1 NADH dehydrogenase subunit 2 [Flustra foliacea]
MKFYPSSFVFFCLALSSVFMVFSSNNWFILWVGLELPLLGFIPMFSLEKASMEGMAKYFLVQAMGSSMFLAFSLSVFADYMNCIFMIFGMLIKLGLFPFFQWVPSVMSSLTWVGCLFLLTIQKLGPLGLVVLCSSGPETMMIILVSGTMSMLAGGMLGFNQVLMKPLMAYSSVVHTGWILNSSLLSHMLTGLYVLAYFCLSIMLFLVLSKNKMLSVVQRSDYTKNLWLVSVLLLGMTGLPPSPIFIPKVLLMWGLIGYPVVIVTMVLSTCVTIYFYFNSVIPNLTKNQ